MTGPTHARVNDHLDMLRANDQYRQLPNIKHQDQCIIADDQSLLNISSNDYLGLGNDTGLQSGFLAQLQALCASQLPKMGSTSSRLLTGNHEQLQLLELDLLKWYHLALSDDERQTSTKSILVLNSGYHANIGILPALAKLPVNTCILSDDLIHASIIDGIRLIRSKQCTYKRYRHNDLAHLTAIIDSLDKSVERIIIVTESVFSMDGDRADLKALVKLKAGDPRIELYVDEAHAVGVLGHNGLGLSEETQTLEDIDYLVGTFGKAFASTGAYIICDEKVREWLINQMRSFIFSTALPPIMHSWTRFIVEKMSSLHPLRTHLAQLSMQVRDAIESTSSSSISSYQSPIIPYVLGSNDKAISKAKQLREAGFYVLPIRPPTVPVGTARIRLVMNARLTTEDCDRLISLL
ncbi:8-amino-7-oxononanoate synthase [Psychrobacter sp. 1Y11]|uniref:8-amino-7-oxononanoate synthase n=1 Tax=Psychrobacter sp. 1Y11 TaxID=3457446 RepID=UPI003FD5C8DE